MKISKEVDIQEEQWHNYDELKLSELIENLNKKLGYNLYDEYKKKIV